MEKITLKYLVDAGLAVSFISVIITAIVKFPGIRERLGLAYTSPTFWWVSRIHDWAGVVMVVLVAIHLFLNREWIICQTKNLFKRH